jgi:hypothetical protein
MTHDEPDVVDEDKDKPQRRKLKATVNAKKDTFMERLFKTYSSRF